MRVSLTATTFQQWHLKLVVALLELVDLRLPIARILMEFAYLRHLSFFPSRILIAANRFEK
jgi:hypothetical protein